MADIVLEPSLRQNLSASELDNHDTAVLSTDRYVVVSLAESNCVNWLLYIKCGQYFLALDAAYFDCLVPASCDHKLGVKGYVP